MAKKKFESAIWATLLIGIIIGFLLAALWNAITFVRYPYPGYRMMDFYMMPMMMNMMGRGFMTQISNVNCSALTDNEFEEIGDRLMDSMMVSRAHEIMEQNMNEETNRLMHIVMGRMATGC
ncbi:MAG: hypothetical protein QXQ18_01650 [Candidatus Aenigmatarchaeota archaeon]